MRVHGQKGAMHHFLIKEKMGFLGKVLRNNWSCLAPCALRPVSAAEGRD